MVFLLLMAGVVPVRAQSITLSPAVVPLGGQPGQSVEYGLSLRNDSSEAMEFVLEARDVVVRDGQRVFVAAGELPGSIAASAVFPVERVRVAAGGTASARVTLTLPPAPAARAVVVLFRATHAVASGDRRALMSLGTLFTFTLSDNVSIASEGLEITPPTPSADLQLRLALANVGAEPAIPQGVAALLDDAGSLIGRIPLPARRLLPGERATLVADYAGELDPGDYRVVVTLDVGGRPFVVEHALRVP